MNASSTVIPDQACAGRSFLSPAAAAALSPQDQRILCRLRHTRPSYMFNPLFAQPNAQVILFEKTSAEPVIDASWYLPVLEQLEEAPAVAVENTLLTPEQERLLFLRYNYCRYRLARLLKRTAKHRLSLSEAREILQWYRQAQNYRDQIAAANLALVLAMIKRMHMTDLDFPELVSEGNMALLRAVDKFDIARGFKFSTYACRAIIKALGRYAKKALRRTQLFPVSHDPKLERSDFQDQKRRQAELDSVQELRRILRENRAQLTPIERQIISYRFAITPDGQPASFARPLTLQQVGRLVGLTKERVRQIQNKAMEKLRQALEQEP